MPLYVNVLEEVDSCSWDEDGDTYTVMSSDDPSTSTSCSDGATKTVCTEVSSGQWECQDYVGDTTTSEENVRYPVDHVNYNGNEVHNVNYNGSEVFELASYEWVYVGTESSEPPVDISFDHQGTRDEDIAWLESNYPANDNVGKDAAAEGNDYLIYEVQEK